METLPEIGSVGSLWRKNDHGVWHPLPGEKHVVRIEQYTPLGRVVLRRMDCAHEYVCDLSILFTAFDPIPASTAVYESGHHWVVECFICDFTGTVNVSRDAEWLATSHHRRHALEV